jgi:voltage-gated potassium channel
VAFISRFPAHQIRTVVLTLLAFVTVALVFSTLYLTVASDFIPRKLDLAQAVYFSFVTISTLGYGDIHPHTENAIAAQMLVVTELIVGLYFLAIILAIVTSWANTKPVDQSVQELQSLLSGAQKPGSKADP